MITIKIWKQKKRKQPKIQNHKKKKCKPFECLSALADVKLWFQKFKRHPKTRMSLMRSFILYKTLVSVRLTHGIIYIDFLVSPKRLTSKTNNNTAVFGYILAKKKTEQKKQRNKVKWAVSMRFASIDLMMLLLATHQKHHTATSTILHIRRWKQTSITNIIPA